MRALITGVTGQDGSYLAELLLAKGYEVYGLVRRSSVKKFDRIETIVDDINLMEGDLTDQSSLDSLIHAVQPDEVYNMAAQSFVPVFRSLNQFIFAVSVEGSCSGFDFLVHNDFRVRKDAGQVEHHEALGRHALQVFAADTCERRQRGLPTPRRNGRSGGIRQAHAGGGPEPGPGRGHRDRRLSLLGLARPDAALLAACA